MFKYVMLSAVVAATLFVVACGGSSNAANTTLGNAQSVQKPQEGAKGAELKFSQDGSSIEFTGRKVTGKHDGGFDKFSGSLTLDKDNKEVLYAVVEIEMGNLWTDEKGKSNAKLDGHLKSDDFFAVEKNPKSKFETTKIEKKGDGYEVTGNLTLRGVTKSLTFPAKISVGEKDVSVKADFKFDRQPFGVSFKGMQDNLIQDEVEMRLNISAKR
ncbi:MAG: YceI family protein [Planctomycetaceae bacterium]|nr:Protein YceI [Planctomycetota bacterium]MCQ3951005.1 YceI family protein [Planctomycetota bacterium]NUO15512.1 YceI family protein [Planctomycetaceae bacterium]GIK52798.1 MAG: polyisoprenoid-binding protein [Planctomycetota bacterium]